ncbi:MAG: AraC family transcriptional regulator [Bacteroidota bacterium]
MPTTQTTSLYHYHKAGEVAAYIKLNITRRDQLSLDDLGQRFGICQTNLTKAFKYRYKTTVHYYIIQTRMAIAREMLCDQRKSVKEIAYSLGYKEINHLTRDFKKIMGMPPTEYVQENGVRQHIELPIGVG